MARAVHPGRRRRVGVVGGVVVLLVGGLAGCSGDDDGRAGAVDDSEPGQVVELESVDSLAEMLSSLGGPTVDDTEIRYTDGKGVVSVGGLQISMPILEDLDYYDRNGRNITVPPSWPTLDFVQLTSPADNFTAIPAATGDLVESVGGPPRGPVTAAPAAESGPRR